MISHLGDLSAVGRLQGKISQKRFPFPGCVPLPSAAIRPPTLAPFLHESASLPRKTLPHSPNNRDPFLPHKHPAPHHWWLPFASLGRKGQGPLSLRFHAYWIGLALCLVTTATPLRAEVESQIRGEIRSRLALFSPIHGDNWALELRARPELVVFLTQDLSATVTVRGQRNLGRGADLLGDGDFTLDRAFIDLRLGQWDLRLGRQSVNFGSALIWNPIDLVDSNIPLDFDIVKNGVDAIRASYSLSSTASLTGLMAFPEDSVLSMIKADLLLGSADISLLAVDDRVAGAWVLGLDLKGDLGVGYWLEGAAHFPEKGAAYQDFVVGLDYSWPLFDRLYLALQFHRDGSGGTGVDNYDYGGLITGRKGFLARDYASILSSLVIKEINTLNGSLIYNLDDDSYITTLSGSRYFFENLLASVRVSLFRGSGPGEFNPVEGHPLEGLQPTESYELWLEWRF